MESTLVPIIIFMGLFTTLSLSAYFRYKTRTAATGHIPGESVAEWHKADAQAKLSASRAACLRVGGLLVGIGIGTALGILSGNCLSSLWEFFGSLSKYNHDGGKITAFVFFIIASAMICGGIALMGTYFLERKLEGKSRK